MRRRCDDIRYDNQLQITHEAKVKVSLRPALVTMSRNSGGRLNTLSGLASHRTYPGHRSPHLVRLNTHI